MIQSLLNRLQRVTKKESFLVEAFRVGENKPFARVTACDLFMAHHFAHEHMEYNGIFRAHAPAMVRHCKIHKPCGQIIEVK